MVFLQEGLWVVIPDEDEEVGITVNNVVGQLLSFPYSVHSEDCFEQSYMEELGRGFPGEVDWLEPVGLSRFRTAS